MSIDSMRLFGGGRCYAGALKERRHDFRRDRPATHASRRSTVAETPCPAPGELSGFVLGTLPVADLQRIARHLDVCAACEAAVRTLEDLGDPVLTAIRDALSAATADRSRANSHSSRKDSSQKALNKGSKADRRGAP
jgi:hypothetical protein